MGLLDDHLAHGQQSSERAVVVQKELAHERARELEEIGRIKSQFLANVTHELRSPVNAIIELSELMRIAAETRPRSVFGSPRACRGKWTRHHVNSM